MLTNTIIVLDSYFNLTNKSYLIDFFDNLIVAYFFGPLYMDTVLILSFISQRICSIKIEKKSYTKHIHT